MHRLFALLFAVPFAIALVSGCKKQETWMICEACIEREGQMFCGRHHVNLTKHPETKQDTVRLDAGRAACVELAARKGGGYAGPPFQAALEKCAAGVTPKDLRRVKCDEFATSSQWHPKDGV